MKRFIILLAAIWMGSLAHAEEQFTEYALKNKNEIFKRLEGCGLNVVSTYDLVLPAPADRVILAPNGVMLARFVQGTIFSGLFMTWKNPNGGMVHTIQQGWNFISYSTPYLGIVAQANQFTTAYGRRYNYICRSQPMAHFQAWDQCVRTFFIDVVVGSLCRFGSNPHGQ